MTTHLAGLIQAPKKTNGGVKLIILSETSPLSETMQSFKCFPHTYKEKTRIYLNIIFVFF